MILPATGHRFMARARLTPLIVLALTLALGIGGCGESTDPDEVIPVPTVSGVDKTTVSPGDTLTVTGSDFDGDVSLNRVKFNNAAARAVPFSGGTTQLRVVVHRNALNGPVSVSRAGQPEEGVGPEITVVRGVGDVWVAAGSRTLEVPTPANAEYLVIPHATGGVATDVHHYSLRGNELPPTATPGVASVGNTAGGAGMTIRESFESRRWEMARELIARVGVPALPDRAAGTAPGEAQEFRQFNVWNTSDEDASPFNTGNYTTITAELRYTGQHILVYTDIDTLGTGNLNFGDIVNFAQTFDADIRPSNTKYFGTESDVDGNGKVLMLITPVVNRLTPAGSQSFIGGFFFSIDLFEVGGGIPSGTSNHAEIFYVLASDPSGVWGVSQPRSFVAEENIKTIVHEYQHLISYSYRLFNQSGKSQHTWLEEGMSHMAEDLLWRETGESKYNTSNEGRGTVFRGDPDAFSIEDDRAPIAQRGAIYLFLRLLGDRFSDDIYKQILQSGCQGRPCIEAITGEGFLATFSEFLAAMYLNGLGINDDGRYNYDSIDLADFGGLLVTNAAFDGADVGSTLRRTAGDFFYFSGSSTPTSRFVMSESGSGVELRTLFVRTR